MVVMGIRVEVEVEDMADNKEAMKADMAVNREAPEAKVEDTADNKEAMEADMAANREAPEAEVEDTMINKVEEGMEASSKDMVAVGGLRDKIKAMEAVVATTTKDKVDMVVVVDSTRRKLCSTHSITPAALEILAFSPRPWAT